MRRWERTNRHDENRIEKISDFLDEVQAALGLIDRGFRPSAGGGTTIINNTIAGVTRHPDLADLNVSDDHAHHPWMPGRAATQEWYGLAATSGATPGGIILHSNNSASTQHARLELSTNNINLYGEVRIFDEAGGGAGITVAEGAGFVNTTLLGTLEVINTSLANPNLTIRNNDTGASAAAVLFNLLGRTTQTGTLFESKVNTGSTAHHVDYYKADGTIGSFVDADGIFNGATSSARATVSLSTNQSADVTTTNLLASAPVGVYAVVACLECTVLDATAGTITLTIGWTDDVGATTDATLTLALTATGRSRAMIPGLQVASGNITYAITNSGAYNNARYRAYLRLVALG